MSEQVERLVEVLGEHYDVVRFNGVWCCTCLKVLANTQTDARLRLAGHLAACLVPLLDAARREAWDEGYWDAKAGAMSGQPHTNPYDEGDA